MMPESGEDEEQIGRFDASYILRSLSAPDHDESSAGKGEAAEALAKRRDAVRIIACQVAFFAACAAQARPVPPAAESGPAGPVAQRECCAGTLPAASASGTWRPV